MRRNKEKRKKDDLSKNVKEEEKKNSNARSKLSEKSENKRNDNACPKIDSVLFKNLQTLLEDEILSSLLKDRMLNLMQEGREAKESKNDLESRCLFLKEAVFSKKEDKMLRFQWLFDQTQDTQKKKDLPILQLFKKSHEILGMSLLHERLFRQ